MLHRFTAAIVCAAILGGCGGPPGPAEFRDHTDCGVRLEGVHSCPISKRVGGNRGTLMQLDIGREDDNTVWAGAWFSADPAHSAPVADGAVEATYSNPIDGDVVARVAEFGEIDGRAVVSAVDITDGKFTARFRDGTGTLRLVKPAKDYPEAIIEMDMDIHRAGGHFETDDTRFQDRGDRLRVTGTNVSGSFDQNVADSSPSHYPWSPGNGPTWVSSRYGVFNIGVE